MISASHRSYSRRPRGQRSHPGDRVCPSAFGRGLKRSFAPRGQTRRGPGEPGRGLGQGPWLAEEPVATLRGVRGGQRRRLAVRAGTGRGRGKVGGTEGHVGVGLDSGISSGAGLGLSLQPPPCLLKGGVCTFHRQLETCSRGSARSSEGQQGTVCGRPRIAQGRERVLKFPRGFLGPWRRSGLRSVLWASLFSEN